jgi:hypothetical protein
VGKLLELFPEFINNNILVEYFGKWPSFNDCEIIEVRLNRELGEDFSGPTVCIEIYLNPQSNPLKIQGSLGSGPKVTFKFYKVDDLEIRDFNHQNQFNDFIIKKYFSDRLKSNRYTIELEGFGADIHFSCGIIEVLSIEKHQPKDYFEQFEQK